MDKETDYRDELRAADVLRSIMVLRDSPCADCRERICGHEALMSLTLGFRDAPRCWPCLAAVLEREKEELRDHLFAYIVHRQCHHAGWLWANREEGFEPAALPTCLWPSSSAAGVGQPDPSAQAFIEGSSPDPALRHDAEWNAGDMACGDLVLQLRIRLGAMRPGEILKVTAKDSGAPEDLPAWCRLTGHALAASHHPVYWIRRKES